jgi:hypothetical protein
LHIKQLVTTLCKPLSHTDCCSQSRTSLPYLVSLSNIGRSFAPGLTSSQAGGYLTPTFYSSISRLTVDCTLLHSPSMDLTENTFSHNSFYCCVASVATATRFHIMLQGYALAAGVFAQPFLATTVSAGFTVLAFSRHATIS